MPPAASRPRTQPPAVSLIKDGRTSPVLIVCEHASPVIPEAYQGLGLNEAEQLSHIAWDPGADRVADHLAGLLNAPYVRGGISRLIYDCNRPPTASDAMPERSEVFDIPGNLNLSDAERQMRIDMVYRPFEVCLTDAASHAKALVTIHSFTPVYHGQERAVHLGILHDTDTRLADLILADSAHHDGLTVRRNEPYGPGSGVMHTLKHHGLANRIPNVMIEIRNDLIATPDDCNAMANRLHTLLTRALAALQVPLGREGEPG